MKIRFTKDFIKKVREQPNHWKDPETILSGNQQELTGEIKINGYLYKLGEEIEIIAGKKV